MGAASPIWPTTPVSTADAFWMAADIAALIDEVAQKIERLR